jgi:hypothetical protein
MGNKSIIQKVFAALQLSVDTSVNCELTPEQCKLLLDDIARLTRLLELERSDE